MYAAADVASSAAASMARCLADFGFCRFGGGEGSGVSTRCLRLRGGIVEFACLSRALNVQAVMLRLWAKVVEREGQVLKIRVFIFGECQGAFVLRYG